MDIESLIDDLNQRSSCGGCGNSEDRLANDASVSALNRSVCRVLQDLGLLLEISKTLEESLELKDIVQPILEKVSQSMRLTRATITILNRRTNEIIVEESKGLGKGDYSQAAFKLGEGLIGKVVENGMPVVIPDISKEPGIFPTRNPAPASFGDENTPTDAFICVPIKQGQEVLGALAIERPVVPEESLQAELSILSLISTVLAQAVKIRQSAHEQMLSLRKENERLQEQIKNHFRPDGMIGSSNGMRMVCNHIEQVSSSDTTVLIRGESGVGKELVARALHKNSNRTLRAFVKVNCAALPDTIIESELFGHEKGAFTGAIAMRKGRFEIAHQGTIFLDEIGDISPSTQVKLLRVLQEKEFERVGSDRTQPCDVRVIAATSRNLEELIEKGTFREDLYYRLNVFPIYVPPLRERKSDVLQLADYFVQKYSSSSGKGVRRISTCAIDLMMSYHWPGNVRELENCIERATLLCKEDAIMAHHLPPTLQATSAEDRKSQGTLDSALTALERELLVDALKNSRGNMAEAARTLGITERQIGTRVRKYGIDSARFRSE